jgi:hypothetical protein
MVDVAGGAWIHPVLVTAWTLSLLLAGGAWIWPVACGSSRWCEDVVPRERDGAVIAIFFVFPVFNQRRTFTLVSDYVCNRRREHLAHVSDLALGTSRMRVSYVVEKNRKLG